MIKINRKGSPYAGDLVVGAVGVLSYVTADYSWNSFDSWLDPESGQFYWYTDSGCSCYGPMEDVATVADLAVGSRDDLIRAYKEFATSEFANSWTGFTKEQFSPATRDITLAIREALKEAEKSK